MPLYFEIDPIDQLTIIQARHTPNPLVKYNTKETSAVNGKSFLELVTIVDPPYDPATQVKEGPVDAYDGTAATRTWTVRTKTQTELDAESLAADIRSLKDAGKDAVIVVTALIDALLVKGTIVAADVEPVARQAYQDLKVIADRVKAP
jgi:hypothetical protein